MSSFFGKLRSNAPGSGPAAGASPGKKDPNQPQPTPLGKLLQDAGPIRNDGSDKFWGMENFGNTCYCNSILQCLYYSVPFREQVINYPKRSPLGSILHTPAGPPRPGTAATTQPNGSNAASSKPKPPGPPVRSTGAPTPPAKPEDKESPEYKKKQVMAAGPILSMNYDNSASYGMPETLFTSLKDIFEALIANRSRTGVVSPAKFLEVLRKEHEMFRTSMHQDAHEFLNLLLNEVVANVESNSKKLLAEKASMDGEGAHSDLEKVLISDTPNTTGSRSPSNTGWVHELFEGTLTSETKCLTCENVSQRDEAFLDLSVDLDQHSSVTSCLRKFSEEEMLCERNKFHCDRCGGLQEAEKRMKIKRLPKILALHLKRFKYTEDLQRLQKLFHRVVYPYHLRLFNTTDDAEDPDRLYELYAVVVHIGGGPYHGHYVSIIKTQDRGWLLFDDEMVEPVDKNYVRNFFGERPGLACAYVLFYQETTLEAVKKEQEAEGLAAAAQSNITPVPKEPQGLGLTLKTNGHHANGHHFVSSLSPTHSIDTASALDRIATETPVMTGTTVGTPLSVAQTAPPSTVSSPLLAVLSQKKSEAQIRKERQREEKERKSAEKELEKVNRGLLKSAELRRKETERKNATDLKAAIEASKLSTKQDTVKHASIDKKSLLETSVGVTIAKPTGRTSTTTPPPSAGADVGLTALPELPPVPQANGTWATTTGSSTGTLASSTLNRFRQSSKSLSKKPKFWGSKADREKGDGRDESAIEDGDGRPPTAGAATAERKTRFSGLRRKTSSMLT